MTDKFSISPRFSPTIFDPDANSVLLRVYLCTVVDSMRRKPCVRSCSREREGLYNGSVQQNPLCAESCVTNDIPISLRFSPTFFYRRANPAPYSAQFLIHFSPNGCTLQIRSSLRSYFFWEKMYKCFSSHSKKKQVWLSGRLQRPRKRDVS